MYAFAWSERYGQIKDSLEWEICTAQNMKFSIKDFFSKCDLVTFTEEILNGELHFLCNDYLILSETKSAFSQFNTIKFK